MSLQIYNDIKGIVLDIIDAFNPTDLLGGTVVNDDPLQIEADVNSELYDGALLVVPEYLMEHKVDVEFSNLEPIEGSFNLPFINCGHEYCSVNNSGKGTFKGELILKNKLKIGDQVMMIKCANGQRYFILDRVHTER